MNTATITIVTDQDTAAKYYAASEGEQRKIQVVLRILLQTPPASTSLRDIMDAMSDKAEARGLTPEILNELLDADD
jgi:hypothetical protein